MPIAFRAGSSGKKRVHIFWQRRINVDDVATPYWYPFKTDQGAMREDRLVFPIPPGVHWSEVEAVALPATREEGRRLTDESKAKRSSPVARPSPSPAKHQPVTRTKGLWFAVPEPAAEKPKRPRASRPKVKIDPHVASKARELRDRWMERWNAAAALPPAAKYDVARALEAPATPARAALIIDRPAPALALPTAA